MKIRSSSLIGATTLMFHSVLGCGSRSPNITTTPQMSVPTSDSTQSPVHPIDPDADWGLRARCCCDAGSRRKHKKSPSNPNAATGPHVPLP